MSGESDPLDEERFAYQEARSGLVQISFQGRIVTRLSGQDGQRFLTRIADLEPRDRQLLMAKATGHFKHGNERKSKPE